MRDYKVLCTDGSEALCHHGIKGMKWGVRRYQNEDGSFTSEGKARYSKLKSKAAKYETKATKAHSEESRYEYKRDKTRSRFLQTDFSIARANRYEKKRAKSNIRALKYESLSHKYDAEAKRMIADSKAAKAKYDEKMHKLTESAIDDALAVMEGSMSKAEYNEKYYGTGWKIS